MVEVIRKKVLQRADICYEISDDVLKSIIDDVIIDESRHSFIPIATMESLSKRVFASIRGLDILEELLEDEKLTEDDILERKKMIENR